jgi:bacterioferritin (cytochrome b1)
MATNTETTTVSDLNHLLRGELSAVETYDLAMKQLGSDSTGTLQENRDSHARQVSMLRERILAFGGVPDRTSGVWGQFAKLMEKGAALAGAKSIYAALEEGEDIGLKEYLDYHSGSAADEVVRDALLPAQQRTHERMRRLKHSA